MTDTRTTEYIQSLTSGLALDRHSASVLSADRMGYYPMMNPREYADVVVTLGRAAAMGGFYATACHEALAAISPYQNGYMMMGAISGAFARIVRGGWFDTANYTSPEPGRYSDNQHDTTPAQAALLLVIVKECEYSLRVGSVPGLGWALAAYLRENAIEVRAVYLPNIAAKIAADTERLAGR